jgi:hypothetical protein
MEKKKLADLSRKELERIVHHVYVGLFVDEFGGPDSLDKDVNGADFVAMMTRVLSDVGLVP